MWIILMSLYMSYVKCFHVFLENRECGDIVDRMSVGCVGLCRWSVVISRVHIVWHSRRTGRLCVLQSTSLDICPLGKVWARSLMELNLQSTAANHWGHPVSPTLLLLLMLMMMMPRWCCYRCWSHYPLLCFFCSQLVFRCFVNGLLA